MKNVLKWSRLNSLKANPEKFQCNSLKANPGKTQFMILGDKTCYKHILKVDLTCVQPSDGATLLSVMIDKNLTFKKDIDNLVRKTQHKLYALRCIRKFLTIEKAKIPGNAFIESQFNSAAVIWMFCGTTFYSKIEKNYHRTLKVIYSINDSSAAFYYVVTLSQFIKGIIDS